MNKIVEHIIEWFPNITETKYWGGILFGALISYVVTWLDKHFCSGAFEWKIAKRLVVIDICMALCILFLWMNLWWLFILIVPWMYFGGRMIFFKREYIRMKKSLKESNQDLIRYRYFMKLEKRKLCSWEVRKYLLPIMNVLFEIGAMKHLDKDLAQLEGQYGTCYEWKRLRSYLCSNRHEFQMMLDLLRPYEDDNRLSDDERDRTILNIYHAYRMLDNEEGVETYILKIEDMVFVRKKYRIEALDDLLYYYETTNNEDGVNKILDISNHIKTRSFSAYLEYIDLQYMHNKRIGNVESNKQLLDDMAKKHSEMHENDGQRLRFGLRLMKLYFENNYLWKEYGIELFRHADAYLSFSQDIAFEYMEAVMLMLRNAQAFYNISLHEEMLKRLFSTMYKYISNYMPEYDKRITSLPDDFVYRKKEMLMRKVTFAQLECNIKHDEPAYMKEMCRLENQIIRLCHDNGEEREALHFLVVQTDDILAYYDSIQIAVDSGIADKAIMTAQKDKPVFMDTVKHNMETIDNTLRQNDYNRSLAYYIFYQSYFNFKVGNIENARYALHKFEDTNVSINNFTIAIQKLYEQVKTGVAY